MVMGHYLIMEAMENEETGYNFLMRLIRD